MNEKRKPEKPSDKAKRKRNRELNDIRVVLNTPEGRRFFWRILSEAKVFHRGYVSGDQGYGTTLNEGKRGIGLWALAELMEARPEAFTQMQRENASEAKREEIEEKEYNEQLDILKTDN